MNICRAADAIGFRGLCTETTASNFAVGVRRRVVDAFASYRKSRAARHFESLPLDCRTLRDIGVTRLGISEAALTDANEVRDRRGRRP